MMNFKRLIEEAILEENIEETPEQFVERFSRLSKEEQDNFEPSENPEGYKLWEAKKLISKIKPNEVKFKKVTQDNSWFLWQDYTHVANVNGIPYGLSNEYEDPDDDEQFVWAFNNIQKGDPYNMRETSWGKGHEDEVMREMINDQESYGI